MALIDVKRDGKNIAAVEVGDSSKMTLRTFRAEIATVTTEMLSTDRFLSKEGSPIDDLFQEDKVMVDAILQGSVVNIKATVAKPSSIRVLKNGKATPVPAKAEDFLSAFRKQLAALPTPLITADERFQEKDIATSTFAIFNEKAFKVSDALDKDQITIVPASPKRDITVVNGSATNSFPGIEESQSLAQFKDYLIANGAMKSSDIFVVGGADVKDEQAGKITVAKAADKDNKIVIKSKQSPLGPDVPPVTVPDTTQNLRDWNQTINYGSPEYPKPPKYTTKVPDAKDPQHVWSALSDQEKQYLFATRQLGSAMVFLQAPKPKPGEETQERIELIKKVGSKPKALMIQVAQPGVIEQNLTTESSFEMTYSQTVNELRKRGATNVSTSVGAKGVAVKGGFKTSNMEINQSDRTHVYMSQLVYKPAVELRFDDEDIMATEAFKTAITAAVNRSVSNDPHPNRTRYNAILSVLGDYGQFIPKRFMLGGAMVIQEVKTIDKDAKIDEKSTSFSAGVGAEVHAVTVAVEAGNTQELKTLATNLRTKHKLTITQIGGDPGTFSGDDPGPWLQTIRYSQNWAVVEYSDLAPTIQYLPPDLLRQCLCLIKAHWADPETEDRTAVNMLEYATIAETKLAKSAAMDAAHEIYG